jgi:hypothetical protein
LRDFLLSSGLERSLLLIGEAEAGLLPFFEGAGLLGELLGNLMRESERGGGGEEREREREHI